MRWLKRLWIGAALLVAATAAAQTPEARRNMAVEEGSTPAGEKSLAILIGVQDYAHARKLEFCRADVRLLESTLRETCRFERVVTLLDDAPDPALRPTIGNLSAQLRRWLLVANTGEYARVLLYFSGHGYRDAQGRLYFAPPDCDPQNLELTALPQSYVQQQLDACHRVRVKLLVLDCCHAGAGRGDGGGTNFVAAYASARGLLTLASCRDEEVSLEWPEKGQGVFTYWLCEGLRGGADRDRDGIVDSDELHTFVAARVLETATELNHQQQVVWRPSDDWRGTAALAVLRPASRTPRGRRPPTAPPRGPLPVVTNSLGMKLALIPAGDFLMGSGEPAEGLAATLAPWRAEPAHFADEYPQHRVRISRAFYLGQTEMTRGQFRQFVRDTGYQTDAERDGQGGFGWDPVQKKLVGPDPKFSWQEVGFPQDDQHPVVNVSWNDAAMFCRWLGQREREEYRLPTEAEWEYACRAGTTTRWHCGDDPQRLVESGNVADMTFKATVAHFPWTLAASDGQAFTAAVGQYRPNGWGLYDMHGNAFEWCADWYDPAYYAASPPADPRGPATSPRSARVVRGGCFGADWCCDPGYSRSAARLDYSPGGRAYYTGFRCARMK